MNKLTCNELIALFNVLQFISVKDLLVSAMHGFADRQDTNSLDKSDVLSKAITSFLA